MIEKKEENIKFKQISYVNKSSVFNWMAYYYSCWKKKNFLFCFLKFCMYLLMVIIEINILILARKKYYHANLIFWFIICLPKNVIVNLKLRLISTVEIILMVKFSQFKLRDILCRL